MLSNTPVIHGEDCVIEMLIDSTYYPVLCATDVTFRIQQEVVLKTGPNSGLFREKTTRLSEAFATVKGTTPVANDTVLSVLYMMQEGVRNEAQDIRLTFTDEAGADKQITGSAIIVTSQINGSINDWGDASVDFEFTGEVEIEEVTAPAVAVIDIFSDYWTTVEGQLYIDGTSAVHAYNLLADNIEILEVDREGIQYNILESGSPGNRDCIYDASTGRITFQTGFYAGETVFVLFKTVD